MSHGKVEVKLSLCLTKYHTIKPHPVHTRDVAMKFPE